MASRGRKIAIVTGLTALAVAAGVGGNSWRELVVRHYLSRLRGGPDALKEAFKTEAGQPLLHEAIIRFVRASDGAERLVSVFLRAYEVSCGDMETYLDSAERMVVGLHQDPSPSGDGRWCFPFAVEKGNFGGVWQDFTGRGQYTWRISPAYLDPAVLSSLLPLAAGHEVRPAERPGIKVRIVPLDEAVTICAEWHQAARSIFQRKEGMPGVVCLLKRESR